MENRHIEAYRKLKEKSDWKFSIQSYHNDDPSEPHFSSLVDVERINLDNVDGHGFIISILTKESIYSFTEENWTAYTGEDYISFCSEVDDETHFTIEFC